MDENAISRRTMLRRLGIGGAIVWSAPVLTSLQQRAYAQGSPQGRCPDDGCEFIGFCPQNSCGDACGCLAAVDDSSKTLCHQFQSCASVKACNSCADCPAGWTCAVTCCGDQPVCVPPCGTPTELVGGPTTGG